VSTFLELCQQVHRKLRIGDNAPGSVPVTVVSQTGDLGDIVAAVQEAWLQLQNHHRDWRWLRGSVSYAMTPNVNTITVANFRTQESRFAHVLWYLAGSDMRYANVRDNGAVTNPDMAVWFIPWQEFSGGIYTRNPQPTAFQPQYWSEQPNRSVRTWPAPNTPPSGGNWLFSLPCRLLPQSLTANTDVPEMPVEFHNIIVWWAVDIFCRTRTNFDRLSAEAKKEVNRQLDQLAADQLPEMTECRRYV
jgi:hypothetical protein